MTPVLTIARGDASRVAEPRRMLARSDEEWRTLWALHAGPDAPSPAIDFAQVVAAAAFAGEKPSAGHAIDITAAPAPNGAVRLSVAERAPGPGIAAAAIITSPFHIVAISRDAGEVEWAADGTAQATPERTTPYTPRPTTSAAREPSPVVAPSTGMAPRTASALAYLAGPFSGALILFAESGQPDVRFHAWQSIIGLGGLGLAIVTSYVLVALALFVSAKAVSLMVGVSYVIWIVLAIVWTICMWKAISGERWKLPLAGDYAERFAARRA